MPPRRTPPKGGSAIDPPQTPPTNPRFALWYRAHAQAPWRAIGTGESEAACTAMIVDAGRSGMKGDWTTLPAGEGPPKSQLNGHVPTLFDRGNAEVQTSAPPPPDNAALGVKVAEYMRTLAMGRRTYEKADRQLAALLQLMTVGDTVDLPDGRRFELVDNFAASNVAFKAAGVRRFELKESKGRHAAAGVAAA